MKRHTKINLSSANNGDELMDGLEKFGRCQSKLHRNDNHQALNPSRCGNVKERKHSCPSRLLLVRVTKGCCSSPSARFQLWRENLSAPTILQLVRSNKKALLGVGAHQPFGKMHFGVVEINCGKVWLTIPNQIQRKKSRVVPGKTYFVTRVGTEIGRMIPSLSVQTVPWTFAGSDGSFGSRFGWGKWFADARTTHEADAKWEK